MGKYLLKVSYTPDGIKGVMKDGGTARKSAVEKMLAGVGGSLESFYFALGSDDVFVIADVPDNGTALAIGAAIASSGAISSQNCLVWVKGGPSVTADGGAALMMVDYR